MVKLPCRAAASKAISSDIEGVSLLGFIHKAHGKTAGFTFALKCRRPENHANRRYCRACEPFEAYVLCI
ncbi:hypothetical protein ALP40_100753 [Pseudomonas viridiflava]|uniref:Uncharacterized protein n=1 Tax=Pseudomonas viridiflava TaxID=33069 RepID=A0A3M5PIU9_PSEVI|nr:hypothetical protein ALP40_100753 [Pseudomonas viridiflava]